MNQEVLRERLSIFLGVVSVLAIIGLLYESGWSRGEVYAAIINFSQVAIPVLVLLAAGALARRSRTYLQVARDALVSVQRRFPNLLMGPRYNRDDYDPAKGQGSEYLFVTNRDPKSRRRAKLVNLNALASGLLLVHIQKGTLVYGLGYASEEATDLEIGRVAGEVEEAVLKAFNEACPDLVEDASKKDKSVAVAIELDYERLGFRRYGRVLRDALSAAGEVLENNRK